MAADDPLFEKALARQLRNRSSDAAAQDGAAPGEAAGGQRALCPDAGVLAAYHERLLDSEEMNLWKQHIFSCGRCQEILSQVENTENIVVNASEEDQMPSVHEGGGIPMKIEPLGTLTAGAAAVRERGPRAAAVAAGAAGATGATVPTRRPAIRYWIVPAGAMAAALLVWIGMHPRSENILRRAEVQSTENRPVPTPTPSEAPADRGVRSGDKKDIPLPEIAWDQTRSANRLDALTRGKSSVKKGSPVKEYETAPSAGASIGVEAGKAAMQADGSVAPRALTATTESVEVSGEASAGQQIPTARASSAPLVSGQERRTAQMAAAPTRPPARKNRMDDAKEKEAPASSPEDSSALMTLQPGVVADEAVGNFRAVSELPRARLIRAPGGNIIWRVGQAGSIERSGNAGGMWL